MFFFWLLLTLQIHILQIASGIISDTTKSSFSDLYTEVTMQNKKLQDEKAELLNQLK